MPSGIFNFNNKKRHLKEKDISRKRKTPKEQENQEKDPHQPELNTTDDDCKQKKLKKQIPKRKPKTNTKK